MMIVRCNTLKLPAKALEPLSPSAHVQRSVSVVLHWQRHSRSDVINSYMQYACFIQNVSQKTTCLVALQSRVIARTECYVSVMSV